MRGPSIYALMNVECFGKEQTSVLCTDQMSFALVTRQVMIPNEHRFIQDVTIAVEKILLD